MHADDEVLLAADTLTSWINRVSGETQKLSGNVAALLESNLGSRSIITKETMAGLDEIAKAFLTRNTFAAGAGTFLATHAVEDGCRDFEWWIRKGTGVMERLTADRSPNSNRYYDFEKLPFFSTPASTGEPTLWGPYIDYLGFEEYVLTFTTPVSIQGNFVGVAGCDIRLVDLEPLIMGSLRAVPTDAALVNASNRVILGNSGAYLVGERIKQGTRGQRRRDLDVPHLGLSLVYTNSYRPFRSPATPCPHSRTAVHASTHTI